MAIPLGGLATGLDTGALIEQLLTVERRPISLLETRKLRFQAQSTAFQDLNAKLLALKSRAEALGNPATLLARSATSSDGDVATVSASPGSLRGSFTLTVTNLARGSIAAAATTRSSLTDTVATGDGTFEFQLGPSGPVVSVSVAATTTLEQLVSAINDENAGVKATAVNTGTPAAPAFKLVLTSLGTGAASDIAVVHDDTQLGVVNTQTAVDAAFNLQGLGNFTRSTNTFSDVLEGVTITLKGAGPTELGLEVDKTATQARLQALLDAYNDVVRTIDTHARAEAGTDGRLTPGAFTGDVAPRQLRTSLAAVLRTALPGTIGTLADLGVTTRKEDGTLTLDAAAFAGALGENSDGVTALLAGTATSDGIGDLVARAVGDATRAVTGMIAARRDGLTASIRSVDRQIETALERLETTERLLRARFTALERTVAELQSTGNALLTDLARLNAQLGAG
jgi:flagellar hook-associated protein 2